MSRRIVFLMLALGGAAVATWLFSIASYRAFGLSPQEDTRTTMSLIKRRVLRFAHEHNKLPNNLAELPQIPGHRNKNIDWWGNPIHFEIDSDGVVTLKSSGGTVWIWNSMEGEELMCQFRSKGQNGEWSDELIDFIR